MGTTVSDGQALSSRRRSRVCWALLFVAVVLPGAADAAQPSGEAAVQAYLDAFANAGPINGAVLVGKDGRVVASGAYGKANIAHDVPNTLDTRFEIASITKAFTAQLIMKHVDDNRISLSAPIRAYLPEFPAKWADQVTIEQLLTHTGGVPRDIADFPTSGHDFPGVVAQVNADFFSLQELVGMIAARPLLSEPGTKYSYSSDGYTILGAVAASVTGQSYEEALNGLILDPLGLDQTGYAPQTAVVRGLALGYRETWEGYENARRIGITPAGGLHSTVGDLFRWTEAVRSGAIMSPGTKDRAWAPSPNITQYGWKTRVDETARGADAIIVRCDGALPGAIALVTLTLEDGITVIVLTNTRPVTFHLDELTTGVIAILRGRSPPPIKRSAARAIADAIASGGVGEATRSFTSLSDFDGQGLHVSEGEINSLGYHFLEREAVSTAVGVFELNVRLFPGSANAHDSLGESYAAAGAPDQAIAHYRKSLDLDPANENARAMLKKLGQ